MATLIDTHWDAIVIGAGVAGLTAAAILAHAGARVVVAERHTIAGGCASFYQRKRFRFDVGATLVGGFGPRGAHTAIFRRLGVDLAARRMEPSMVVHLPDRRVVRYGDDRWKAERRRVFGEEAEGFWNRSELLADAAWEFSAHLPALPADLASLRALLRGLGPRGFPLAAAFGRTVDSLFDGEPSRALRAFVDAQLLITAQADARSTDLTYGVTALDLAREGSYHLRGGIGAIATALGRATRAAGSSIAYGTRVARIDVRDGCARGVTLEDGRTLSAPIVIAAFPALDLVALAPQLRASRFGRRVASLPQRWGAFTLYCGVPRGVISGDAALHHQIVMDYAALPGEGNTAFVSLSAPGEPDRAPKGGRAMTISTHTDVAAWERARRDGSFGERRAMLQAKLLQALERAIPGAGERFEVLESGTPATFEHYTGRARGLVGGIPQTTSFAGLRSLSHRTPLRGLYLCGDSAFPGQSTVGATISGVAAARAAGVAI